MIDMWEKYPNTPNLHIISSVAGPSPTIIQISRTHRLWKLPSFTTDKIFKTRPRGYKKIMLNSTEYEILNSHKYKKAGN